MSKYFACYICISLCLYAPPKGILKNSNTPSSKAKHVKFNEVVELIEPVSSQSSLITPPSYTFHTKLSDSPSKSTTKNFSKTKVSSKSINQSTASYKITCLIIFLSCVAGAVFCYYKIITCSDKYKTITNSSIV